MVRLSVQNICDQITPVHVIAGCSAMALVVMVIGTCGMFSTDAPLPPPRDPPPPVEKSAVMEYRFKEDFFKALVHEDSAKFKAGKLDMNRLRAGNQHLVEFTGNHTLEIGRKLETRRLLLQALKKRVWVGAEGAGIRTSHLVLAITNKTDMHLAYRVRTKVRGKCHGKGAIAHNAIALRPKEKLLRTECLFHGRRQLKILEVELLELPAIGYAYVSRLDPKHILLSWRTSEGHTLPEGMNPCRTLPWRTIQSGIRQGNLHWRDVIDFYARHNCDEYSFFSDYRYNPDGPARLPVIPTSGSGANEP